MCFRITRILSDGSIRLVLEDEKNTCENSDLLLENKGLLTNENGAILVKYDLVNKIDLDGYLTKDLNK